MIWLFRYLKGYLYIEISGSSIEQILNNAAKNRLSLWNLKYSKGKIIGGILISDFKKLRLVKKGIKAKIKIIKKCGLPFKTTYFKKRTGLVIGAVIFLIILKFLSGFIWCIDIQGNKSVNEEYIKSACNILGIKEGISLKDISANESAQNLLLAVPELAWASINIEGCKATINVTEVKLTGDDVDAPTNIKAAFDGQIQKIDVTSGTVCVKVGDTVKKGDLLVSGVTEDSEKNFFVHSSGIITAKTSRVFVSTGEYNQTLKLLNGKKKSKTVLTLFNIDIPFYLGKESLPYFYKIEKEYLKINGKKLPVYITKKEFSFYYLKSIVYTKEELIENLKNENYKKINNSGIDDYKILQENIIETENGIKIEIIIETIENIALQEKIIIDS